MAWVNPITWTVNQLVTAANLNEQIRDNMNAIVAGNTASAAMSTSINPAANVTDVVSVALTTHGGPVLMWHQGGIITNSTGISQGNAYLAAYVDGSGQSQFSAIIPVFGNALPNATATHLMPGMALITGLSAASHTFSWRDTVGDGSSSWSYSGTAVPLVIKVVEIGF